MKEIIKLLVLLGLVTTISCAKQSINESKYIKKNSEKEIKKMDKNLEEQEVINVYKSFYEYKINKNIKELEKILDKNFILTHMTGYKQSKDEWFSQIMDEQMKYYNYRIDNLKVTINNNKAELIGRSKTDARIYGYRNNWNLQLRMPMEKINGKWIILEAVANSY